MSSSFNILLSRYAPNIGLSTDSWFELFKFFFSELRREKLKADKKGNLKEVATLANYLGELLAKNGEDFLNFAVISKTIPLYCPK